MDDIEKELLERKKQLDEIKAPDELEGRLKLALDAAPVTKKVMPKWVMTIVALFFLSLVSYNYNGLAYYGKKIIGFDDLMGGTLAELNEEGMGQTIGQQVVLEDGSQLTVDGIMTDANQLILYYTLSKVKDQEDITFAKITGFLTDSNRGAGTSMLNEEQSEIKGELFFDPVSPFAKKLMLEFTKLTEGGAFMSGSISFPYDPNKAMQTEIKQNIKKKVKVDKGKINFKTITATPTVTMIKGTVDVENLDRVQLPFDKVELLANGQSVELLGSGITSSLGGAKFELRFSALPKKLDSLELVVNEFVGYTTVNEQIPLSTTAEQPFKMNGYDLWVKDAVKTDAGVEITIATDEDVLLDDVSVEGQDGIVPLETTLRQNYETTENEKVVKVRTLLFATDALPDTLQIKGMHHMKAVGEKIEIPVK
ncbi:DUF4179 domain-containing protein [Sporosarcina koreensis]|uniref:DUF4179 domain-containing protein n=1 Tax=Sporosarcina koreensis TaxID=334735 RepID=UPI0007588F6F|nr:DUF4179 domain-containing protein [Sporosarcina koreensis]